ncbi:MAG: hypothetical protein KME55_11790 [Nostoc indistinguendum CM1-VF10]|nr:hypothetical protein [Nostoc indistinguendum CM1-VF10]
MAELEVLLPVTIWLGVFAVVMSAKLLITKEPYPTAGGEGFNILHMPTSLGDLSLEANFTSIL